jgi:hypothetical protein
MRVPSRRMIRPPDRSLTPLQAALLFGGIGAPWPVAHLAFHWQHPIDAGTFFGLGVVACLAIRAWMFQRKQLRSTKRLLSEGTCQFARSFDRHRTDTWVLRAVY